MKKIIKDKHPTCENLYEAITKRADEILLDAKEKLRIANVTLQAANEVLVEADNSKRVYNNMVESITRDCIHADNALIAIESKAECIKSMKDLSGDVKTIQDIIGEVKSLKNSAKSTVKDIGDILNQAEQFSRLIENAVLMAKSKGLIPS